MLIEGTTEPVEEDGYECMIGVFLVSDLGMIYRYLMHRI
jgi:hypothetical protein